MTIFLVISSAFPCQEEKDSDSSKETLDDLFPDDQDDQAPGSKSSLSLLFLPALRTLEKVDPGLGLRLVIGATRCIT